MSLTNIISEILSKPPLLILASLTVLVLVTLVVVLLFVAFVGKPSRRVE